MGKPIGTWARGPSILTVLVAAGCGSPSLPDLSPEDLAAARTRWQSQAIADYELDLRVHGTDLDPAVIHLAVRDDSVVTAERAGVPMTGDTIAYTVPGLFATLERELELKANPAAAGAPPGYQVHVQADFDPELGYPRHYRRTIGGSNTRVEVETLRFARR
jgi:Family of unknown function (DUF6174)